MSFFGYLAAGAAEGLGRGISANADYEEKLAREQALIRERADQALMLQRQRAEDKAELYGSMGGGGGGKGSGSMLENMMLSAKTDEDKAKIAAYVKLRAGADAAASVGEFFNLPGATETVNPTAGDFARFDRRADPETGDNAAPVPTSYVQRAAYDAEKGRISFNRLLAMADPAKYDDFIKGESAAYGLDTVRNAKTDEEVRQAGGRVMALEGKDRFAVQGDQIVDKSGGTTKQTDLGNAKASDERASAGKHSADAKRTKESGADPEVLRSVQQLRMSADAQLKDARKELSEFDKLGENLSSTARNSPERVARRAELQGEITTARGKFTAIDQRLDGMTAGKVQPAAAPTPSQQTKPTEAPRPNAPSASSLPPGARQIGTSNGKPVYQLPNGDRVIAK